MPMQKGQQSQPAAIQGRPPPPIPSNCPPPPPPPQCIIFCGKHLVQKIPVALFDRHGWTCKEAMGSCNFLPLDNVVSFLCLGDVDIRAAKVFYNYVRGRNTEYMGGDDCVFNPSEEETLLWQPFKIELDIHIMEQVGKIAAKFKMSDLKEEVVAWVQNRMSRILDDECPDDDGVTVQLSPQQVQWFDMAYRHEMAKK
ncbi:hypothetical protein H634G_08257 [Metarhizium anisopliae BRIP 53293]|uniref:Uncharacterized protein n=1 Tax=Metarhizium anisopliae BRIP 53293 TaxID=1291518 RepID=A0A0D9NR37_METAN|nr:hypothetical protein H634G_08257 [Metarhizium anisopliae BRIP 53293]KJK94160.1 hypothetical protein H633G_01953 [Metarhizium anisopliae BRIP 53284]